MTFLNSESQTIQLEKSNNNKQDMNEMNEAKTFKNILAILSIVLFFIVLFFVYSNYFGNSLKANNTAKTNIISNSKLNTNKENFNTIIALNTFENNVENTNSKLIYSKAKIELLKVIEEKEIFKIASSNPEGLYVMVGSFSAYENAIKMQNMNPTEYTCHIFEPNHNEINRVGLFISEKDVRKSENALTEIRNFQKNSWLLYNIKN